jgi:hypothetical protein
MDAIPAERDFRDSASFLGARSTVSENSHPDDPFRFSATPGSINLRQPQVTRLPKRRRIGADLRSLLAPPVSATAVSAVEPTHMED